MVVLALTREDAEVLQRRCDKEAVSANDRLADGQRLAKDRFGGRDVLFGAQAICEIVEDDRVEQRARLAGRLHGGQRLAGDLLRLLQIAGALAEAGERDQGLEVPRMRRAERTLEDWQDLADACFRLLWLARSFVELGQA